jgi:hypothetical protein
MFCQFCGAQLRRIARYCKNCGGRVDEIFGDEPAGQPVSAPLLRDDQASSPWRQNENAIILPITRELPRVPIENFEVEEASEVVPISHPRVPTLVDSPVPLDLPRQAPRPGIETASNSTKDSSRSPALPARRRKHLLLGIPLLLLAVILLFVLAILLTK